MTKYQITEETIEDYCNEFFSSWEKLFRRNLYEAQQKSCNTFIKTLKTIYLERPFGSGNEIYTQIYIFLIIAKALEDVSNLAIQTRDKQWPQNRKKVELIWGLLWDAKERFGYFTLHYSDDDPFSAVQKQLDQLESFFYDTWGSGLYMSTEIKIKKAVCNVCQQNVKSCEHITGNIYDGIPCKEIVQDCSMETVSLVQAPYDMRCRIWPWNLKGNRIIEGRIFSLANIDDFILQA